MQQTPPIPQLEQDAAQDAAASAPNDTGETTPQVAPESMPSTEELLREAELRAAEHHDAWLRARAETENLRRRAQEDIAKTHKFAVEKFAQELLAVKDSLEAALGTESESVENMKAGVELTLKQLAGAFEKSGIAEVNPLGEKFDPHLHQAITTVEAEGEPNRVVNVLQKGYVLHERVIRPALVVVSKAQQGT